MDINHIPSMFQSKIRLAVVSALLTGEKTFKEIKDITKATDGNLSVHISKLESEEYITVKKDFFQKKPRTRYTLTVLGRAKFVEYVNLLEAVLKNGME